MRSLFTLIVTCAVFTFLSNPVIAQPDDLSESSQPSEFSPLTAAGWCVVKHSRDNQDEIVNSPENPDDNPDDTEINPDDSPEQLGCDIGAGLALYRWKRLSVVAN